MNPPLRRNRLIILLCCLGIIAIGLTSRKYPQYFPAFLGKYLGDGLWTAMVYFIWAWLFPNQSFLRITLIATLISFGVEFAQLIQWPWLKVIRETTLGHLVLGTTFSPKDLSAYFVGAFGAMGLDILVFPAIRREVSTQWFNRFRR